MQLPPFLNHRAPDTHKGHYGHALLVAGRYGSAGAAILAAEAALRTGAGLLTVHLPDRCVNAMQTAVPEAMVSVDPSPDHWTHLFTHEELARYDAIAVGPAIGTDSTDALRRLLQLSADIPMVVDADALNTLSRHPDLMPLLSQHRAGVVVTPHAREYERLFGPDAADDDRLRRQGLLARQHGWVIVRKGHRTHIADTDGTIATNTTGNAGMATAGSGDVLTGIILGIMAQNKEHQLTTAQCAQLGVWLHGKSGDLAVQKQSECSLIARDLIKNLCVVTM